MADEDAGLALDELATERARKRLAEVFAEAGVPGHQHGELYHFGFGSLVGRVEIMKSARAETVHAHLSLSSPLLATPVLDCWAGMADGPAAALDDALRQWAAGAYWAYHDALAHSNEPTYELELAGAPWCVFEAPLASRGGSPEALEAIVALGPTRRLLEAPELKLSPWRAHRLRWVAGMAHEVILDDTGMPALVERLQAIDFPTPTPVLLRHSAVLLPRELARARRDQNVSIDDADAALGEAGGLVEADRRATVLSALQHGLELDSGHVRGPELCLRWSQLELEMRPVAPSSSLDVPISRALLLSYAAMAEGSAQRAWAWLSETAARSSALADMTTEHVLALSRLYAEHALPERTESLVHTARHVVASKGSILSTAISSLEAPSAVAALQAVAPEIEVSFGHVPTPDPRVRAPQSQGAPVLWTYQIRGFWAGITGRLGTAARPAVPAPAQDVADAVAGLARRDYSRKEWGRVAGEIAARLTEAQVPHLLSVMVHPPALPERDPWDARFAVMCAAAFVLARLGSAPGLQSRGADALVGLLDGPVDWTVTAAAIALVDLALRSPESEEQVRDLLIARLGRPMSPIWYMCFYEPVSWLLLRLPSLPAHMQERFVAELLAEQ
jgi:hypothetical protein